MYIKLEGKLINLDRFELLSTDVVGGGQFRIQLYKDSSEVLYISYPSAEDRDAALEEIATALSVVNISSNNTLGWT